MEIEEALDILESFLTMYEMLNSEDRYRDIEADYEATKVILREYKGLRKEVIKLAIESIERDKILARLEAEVMIAIKMQH